MMCDPTPVPRRVLMTADTVGGVWTYALELARALEPFEVQVSLASMGAPLNPAQEAESDAIPNLEVHQSRFALEWMSEPWDDLARAGDWLLELAESVQPDLVHLNGFVHGALPWNRPSLVVGHSCVLSWWSAVKREPAPSSWNRYRDAVAEGLRAADLVAAPSADMLASLNHFYGPLSHTRLIPNGRHGDHFRPGRKEPFLLAAGRLWDEAKNLALLARVAPDLPWPVRVAGEPAHPDGTSSTLDSFEWLGRLSSAQLSSEYGRASIYALPARYEPFGLSALEAALSGCALVLGDIPSLREVWGEVALFVDPDDDRGLVRLLRLLIDDPALRVERAHRALEKALTYSPRRMALGYLAAYRELMAGVSPVPTRPGRRSETTLV